MRNSTSPPPGLQRQVLKIAGNGYLTVVSEPAPAPGAGMLQVRVHASVISPGTELGWARGRPRTPTEDGLRTFGYQNAGEVVALGEGCRGFAIGQRVAGMGGDYAIHGSYACIPQNMAVPLPSALSFEEGAFAALAATALHAARRGDVVFGEQVVVMGLGLVGQLTAQVCHAAGASVLALDTLPPRVRTAQVCGIDAALRSGSEAVSWALERLVWKGADCGFICFGGDATAALKDLTRMMKRAPDSHWWGKVVIVGGATVTHGFGADLGNLDLRSAARTGPGYHDPAYERGADYPPVFVRWDTRSHLELFVRWTEQGKFKLKELFTDVIPIDAAPAVCADLIDNPGSHLGVIIRYPHA